MRISDWSSDVCSSDLAAPDRDGRSHAAPTRQHAADGPELPQPEGTAGARRHGHAAVVLRQSRGMGPDSGAAAGLRADHERPRRRSEEHTSELQSLMRISYAVFCLKKTTQPINLTA